MDEKQVAGELVRLAKRLTGGTWSLPDGRGVIDIVKFVKRMDEGKWPVPAKKDLASNFYNLLGDDDLADRFDAAERHFLQECADAVRRRVKELAAQPESDYADPEDYRGMQVLAQKLGVK